jgi:hypothetical protein
MITEGFFDAGHLGKTHLKLLNQSAKYDLIEFLVPIEEHSKQVCESLDYHRHDMRPLHGKLLIKNDIII